MKTRADAAAAKIVAVPLAALHAAAWNPRSISDARFQNLCASVQADPDLLWRRPVLAQADGTIYAGNMRYRAAQHLGFERIPAVVEDVPDQLARERALRDNQQWGEWEEDELAALLVRLREDGSNVDLLGFDQRELQQLLDRLNCTGALADPDDVPPLPDEPTTKLGDLWKLGDHRVLCGDATDGASIARLMDGTLASCMWTDPPYGVDYVGGTKQHLTIKNDTPDGLRDLLQRSFAGTRAGRRALRRPPRRTGVGRVRGGVHRPGLAAAPDARVGKKPACPGPLGLPLQARTDPVRVQAGRSRQARPWGARVVRRQHRGQRVRRADADSQRGPPDRQAGGVDRADAA